jgi:mRNA-degrading endonuclease RelE of RelBE toxin-antitoxin system
MILLKTCNYIKSSDNLSKKDRTLLIYQEKLLAENIYNSKLHTKKLKGFADDKVFSFRITRSYRGIFRIQGKEIILFAIGHRKNIYESI